MQIDSLNHVEFSDVIECFNESFADYFVKMPTTIDFWEKRWKAARVDYNHSFGMFDGNDLVGFIVNGIDFKGGLFTAFNSGTGVLPAYRGRKIVKQLYEFAIPKLLEKGIQICALEVITENEKAIRAYQSAGFEITKTLKCYSGELKTSNFQNINLVKIPFEEIIWDKHSNQQFYSWDNQKSAIKILKNDFEYFNCFENENLIGYFIINPKTGYLAQFDLVIDSNEGDWLKLFSGIKNIISGIRINNIDDRQKSKISAVENVGLNNTLDQYEMEYLIKTEN